MTTNITSHADNATQVMAHATELRVALTDWAMLASDGFRNADAAKKAVKEIDAISALLHPLRSTIATELRVDNDAFMASILKRYIASDDATGAER